MPKLSQYSEEFRKKFEAFRKIALDPQNAPQFEELLPILQNPDPDLNMPELRKLYRNGQWPTIWLSPTAGEDLRHLRPYFLVPLLETADPGEQEVIREEMLQRAREKEVTDIFVMSHGWHRNYFDAVSVYDRLLSRFQFLLRRGRIKPQNPKGFEPLFMAVHWHSDPGKNGWTDGKGSRKIGSFLELAFEYFEPTPGGTRGAMRTDFENLFSFLSHMSAPGVDPLQASKSGRAAQLTKVLDGYLLREGNGTEGPEEKVTALWRCFFEAEPERPLMDQSTKARRSYYPWQSLQTLVRFVLAIVLPLGLINFGVIQSLAEFLIGLGPVRAAAGFLEDLWLALLFRIGLQETWFVNPEWRWPIGLGAYLILGTAALYLIGSWRGARPKASDDEARKANSGLPIVQLLLWLPLQVVTALPILIFLFTTFIFRTPYVLLAVPLWIWEFPIFVISSSTVGWVIFGLAVVYALVTAILQTPLVGLYPEKLRHRNDRAMNTRDLLAAIGRWPIRLVRKTVGEDSLLFTLTGAIDNQFAFFEMQRKGVDAGRDVGRFLERLLASWPSSIGPLPRIHLIGHSFGGLVIHNALDRLYSEWEPRKKPVMGGAWQERELRRGLENQGEFRVMSDAAMVSRLQQEMTIHSLSLINSATASAWFHDRKELLTKVCGAFAAIYSKYDSANSFWYPLANNGRMAAGSVGLWDETFKGSPVNVIPTINHIATVVKPPNCVLCPVKPSPVLLNLDASRIAFEGAVATGGGHDDIFKDEIVHLLWGVSQVDCAVGH